MLQQTKKVHICFWMNKRLSRMGEGRWPKTFGFVCINQSIAKKVLLKTMWEKQLSSCSRGLCTKYKHSTFFCLSIYLYYSGWSLANLVSLAYSSEWEVKICFLWAKKKLRQPSKGFWLSIIEHINFEICASKFCANLSKKLQNQNFFVGKLTIQLGMSDEQYGFT